MTATRTLRTLGEFKKALKDCSTLYVWVNWQGDEGDYIEVPKSKFLKSIGADVPNDGAHGGPMDATPISYRVDATTIYVN